MEQTRAKYGLNRVELAHFFVAGLVRGAVGEVFELAYWFRTVLPNLWGKPSEMRQTHFFGDSCFRFQNHWLRGNFQRLSVTERHWHQADKCSLRKGATYLQCCMVDTFSQFLSSRDIYRKKVS